MLRRFVPNASVSLADLDVGVKDCISAKTVCTGYEVNQKATNKKRDVSNRSGAVPAAAAGRTSVTPARAAGPLPTTRARR